MAEYSNAEKLLAVVETWAKPRIAKLPMKYRLMSPMMTPLLHGMIKNIPDDMIPQAASAVIDNAIIDGSVKLFDCIVLERNDLIELQHMLRLNLKCEDMKRSGYVVITE